MFRQAKFYGILCHCSVGRIVNKYGITSGVLVLDESDRAALKIQNEYTKFISNTTKQRRVCQWADSRFAAFGHRFHNHTYWF
jgi:hypothetical protein